MKKAMIEQPIFFERNRAYRVYLGGKLFSDFFGDAPEDSNFPEEWIASAVRARNDPPRREREGVSVVEGTDIYFDDLIEKYRNELLGPSGKLRLLVKVLDSAIRLPAQAHPDRAFSRLYFNSEYGKTESWLILGTRPGAKLFFGFKEDVTEEEFARAIEESEYDKNAMERLLCPITPEVGEMYIVPAKTAHAIGAGCLILEIQEPTDFTIQPERYCGEHRLSDHEMYLGIDKKIALNCFTFGKQPESKCIPVTTFVDNTIKIESLIGPDQTNCFVVNRITLTGGTYDISLEETYGIYIVTEGEGMLLGDGYERPLKKGDYFFVGVSAMGQYKLSGNLTVVECY